MPRIFKTTWTPVLIGLILLPFVLASRGGTRLTYAFHVPSDAEREVGVTLTLEDPPDPLEIHPLVERPTSIISDLEIRDSRGQVLPYSTGVASGGSFLYRCSPGKEDELTIRYKAKPGQFYPGSGAFELRQSGAIGPSGVAVSVASLLVVPQCSLKSVALVTDFPAEWQSVEVPRLIEPKDENRWWNPILVSGRFDRVDLPLGEGITLSLPEGTSEAVLDALQRILGELSEVLGPPREPLHVICASPEGELPVEMPSWARGPVVDLRATDPESLRSLVRAVVPRWFGGRPSEVETDEGGGSWFLLGLSEYLAMRVPVDVGLMSRDVASSLELNWIKEGYLDSARIEQAPSEGSPALPILTRRYWGAAVLHEAERRERGAIVSGSLAEYDGRGVPAALLPLLAKASESKSFLEEWRIDLAAVPARKDAGGLTQKTLRIAFTSDLLGFLEGCGCKLAEPGGVAQLAGALAKLRKEQPELALIDLGNFSLIDLGHSRLEPFLQSEFALFVDVMRRLDFDAVACGPDELYSGTPLVRSPSAARLPLVGLGIEDSGESLYPGSLVFSRAGLRLGVIAFSELVEHGVLRQAQERNMQGIAFPTTIAALTKAVEELRPSVDLLIVAGHMRPQTLRAMGEAGLPVDLVLSGGLAALEGVAKTTGFIGGMAVALDETSGSGLNQLEVFLDAKNRVLFLKNESVLLSRTDPKDEGVQAALEEFYADMAKRPDLMAGTEPLFAWDAWQRDDYVGAESCSPCHAAPAEQWHGTRHSTAMDTLKKVHRNNVAKCVRCHVVGLGRESGYQIARPDPKLAGVQCETCHGSGGMHVQRPSRENIRRTPSKQVCLECHDQEHSDAFEARFEQAWAQVRH